MKSVPMLKLETAKSTLALPLTDAAWVIWKVLTYPLQILTGYLIFGWQGALFMTAILLLNFRGKL